MGACIVFPGCKNAAGYGVKWHVHRMVTASRLAYAEAHGLDVFTMGGSVMHTCDNPPCVNPEHLVLGTHADNMADMATKGRAGSKPGQSARTRGTEQPASKLTEANVVSILSRYTPRCAINGARALGREFGVAHTQISGIVTGRTWKHVGGGLSYGHY